MPAQRLTLVTLALLAGAGGGGAGAQVTTREVTATVKDPTLFTRAPIASVSFAPYQTENVLEGARIVVALRRVSMWPVPQKVFLERVAKPTIEVIASSGLVDGVYSVAYFFGGVSSAATVTLGDRTGVVATCTLQAQLSDTPMQKCEATNVQVSGGQLYSRLELGGTGEASLNVMQITVNRYR